MSLFNDEEEAEPEKTKLRLWTGRVFYGVLIFFIFSWVMLRLLMSLGGGSDSLRQGIEEALGRATGLEAQIGHFNYMKFFPDVSFDAADVTLFAPATATQGKTAFVKIGTVQAAVDFWSAFLARNQIKQLEVRDIDIGENPYLQRPLHIDEIALKKDALGPGQAALIVEGKYGGDAFHGSLAMTWTTLRNGQSYFSRPAKSPFSFQSPFLTIQGNLSQAADGDHLAIDSIGAPESLLSGSAIIAPGSFDARLKGDSSSFVISVKHSKGTLTGSVHMPSLDIADAKITVAAGTFYDFAMPLVWVTLAGKNGKIDLDVQIDQLMAGAAKAGQLSFPVHGAAGVLTAGPLKGEIAGGELTGQLTLDNSKKLLSLTLKTVLKDIQYAALEGVPTAKGQPGQATVDITVASQAAASADLVRNLSGEAAIVGGSGQVHVRLIDKAGQGLVKTLLPQSDPESMLSLDCVLADFRIKGGIATPDTLFFNADKAAVAGAGSIDLAGKKVDLTLTPKPGKQVGAGAAHLSGPWSNPNVQRGAGAFPAAITPSFLSFSMTDMGLSDRHPCHAFIGKAAP